MTSSKTCPAAKKPGHFSNWLSFLCGNEDAMMALVLASELKIVAEPPSSPFSKPQLPFSGHIVQIVTMPGQVGTA